MKDNKARFVIIYGKFVETTPFEHISDLLPGLRHKYIELFVVHITGNLENRAYS